MRQIRRSEKRLGAAKCITIGRVRMPRKLIELDDDTLQKLTVLARDRMATFQELADEAFADLLKKHGVPVDLKDALKKSAKPPPHKKARRSRS